MNKRRIALSDKPRPYELDRLSKALTHSLVESKSNQLKIDVKNLN